MTMKERYIRAMEEYHLLAQIKPFDGGVELRERFGTQHTERITYEQLCQKYNSMVEAIWSHLKNAYELNREIDDLMYAHDKVSEELYSYTDDDC